MSRNRYSDRQAPNEKEFFTQSQPMYGYGAPPPPPPTMMRQAPPYDNYGQPPNAEYPSEFGMSGIPPPPSAPAMGPPPAAMYDVAGGAVPLAQHQQDIPPPVQQPQPVQSTGGSDYHRSGRGHRGGPGGDHQQVGGSSIPDEVVEYLRYFKRCVEEQNVPEIHTLYEYGFSELTERYYRDRFWPDGDKVAQVVGGDSDIFLILYRELYYRYLYAKMQRPSMEHRWHSYHNYQALFGYILNAPKPISLSLPNHWLWDIIDEFVYQFQSFCQYKANLSKRTSEELEELRQMENQMWNLYPIMNILYSLVRKSQVNEQLCAMKKGTPLDFVDEFGSHPLYFPLGYFSLIGLLRLHTLLGDYYQALKAVGDLEFGPKGLYNTVSSCLVTLHYYVGFCRMMMRHYQDAIRIFVDCLLFIQRTRNMNQQQQQQHKNWQYDVISKTNDQVYHLLAICLSLQPQRIDESVQSQLTEKMSEKISRMQRGEIAEFENAFTVGSPKFLSPTIPNTDGASSTNFAKEPSILQTRVFMEEIKQQALIPVLRGYLKLYTTMPISKLASFMEKDQPELLSFLLSFKHKMCNVARETSETEEEGAPIDLDFYIDGDMIVIADTKVARRYGEYFIRHIQKLMELNNNLKKVKGRSGPVPKAGGKA